VLARLGEPMIPAGKHLFHGPLEPLALGGRKPLVAIIEDGNLDVLDRDDFSVDCLPIKRQDFRFHKNGA